MEKGEKLLLMLDFYVKTRVRFSLRDKRLFEITEVEITRVDCIFIIFYYMYYPFLSIYIFTVELLPSSRNYRAFCCFILADQFRTFSDVEVQKKELSHLISYLFARDRLLKASLA